MSRVPVMVNRTRLRCLQLFRTARKRNASIWGISQTAEDYVGTETSPRAHGPGIVKNSTIKIIGQQPGDMRALRDHLHLNETAPNQIKHFSAPIKGKTNAIVGELLHLYVVHGYVLRMTIMRM